MNKTDELIQNLVKDLRPIKKKYGWRIPLLIWIALIIFIVGLNYYFASLFIFQKENEVKQIFGHPIFYLGILSSLSAFFTSLFAALPGRNFFIWKVSTHLLFSVWSIAIFYESYKEGFIFNFWEILQCSAGTVLAASLYFLVLYYFLKKRYILDFQSAFVGGVLTSSITGTLCIGVMCFEEGASHIFFGHYMPTLILFTFAYIFVRIRYKLR